MIRALRCSLPLALAVLAGCGSNGPPRYQLSGNVTYDGKPLPKGFVILEPDTSRGNDGPGGGAEILDGAFRTARNKGVVGGPYIVRIMGHDGVPTRIQGHELRDGQSLFDPYQTTVDFPRQDSERDFTIPPRKSRPSK